MKRLALTLSVAALLVIAVGWALLPATHAAPMAAPSGSAPQQISPAPSPTPTRWCPTLTPEPLWVEPVTSPTDLLAQTIVVRIGNGQAVTVTMESGVFTTTGSFNTYSSPALVGVTLLPDTLHHLAVAARVRSWYLWEGCIIGGYTLRTRFDRNGHPLVIEQQAGTIIPTVTPTTTPSPTPTPTPTMTPLPTPTLCPLSTPEPLWVEPVISPTDRLTQTITVRIGNGEAVTVTAESGVFTTTGRFDVYGNPAQVTMDLLAATTHHLDVWAKVRRVEQWGCVYGDYTLHTARDRDGRSLLIEQRSAARFCYLPMILR